MTQPGQTVEGITVPLGDPEALAGASRQLDGVSGQLESSAGRIFALPSLMGEWAGPGSSAFVALTGRHATDVQAAGVSVSLAAMGVRAAGHALHAAQQKAQRAITKAEHARAAINKANADIAAAQTAERLAAGRMVAAASARDTAAAHLSSGMAGSGVAMAALQAADAEYRDAEHDLHEAQRAERRAGIRLQHAQDDLKAARKQGGDAAQDAQDAGFDLQAALAGVPAAVYSMPGAPARGSMTAAAGIPRPQPVSVPVSERQPPRSWPGWAKAFFKIGRGEVSTVDGTVHMVKSGVEHPGKIPGALGQLGSNAVHHPLGTLKGLVGYDELARGRYEDWFGQMGIGMLGAGAGSGLSRAARLRRIVGSPDLYKLGPNSPRWGAAFAGRRVDFRKPDLGARPGSDVTIPKNREALAAEFPKGVRFTRAGYPVFTRYAEKRVTVPHGLNGEMYNDSKLANRAAHLDRTPRGYTWHHVEDGTTMELVPTRLHKAVEHTGGRPAITVPQLGEVTPGSEFTTHERLIGGFGAAGGFATTGG